MDRRGFAKGGKPDSAIIAVVKLEDQELLDTVTWAQVLNLNTGLFSPISTEGVECYNEGRGL